MSSKLFVLAALMVLPFASHAQENERDMHVFQMCPSTSYEACANYQKVLQAHANKPDFESVRLKLQEKLATDSARSNGRSASNVKTAKAYEDLLIHEGVSKEDAAQIARARFGRASLQMKKTTAELSARTKVMGEQMRTMKKAMADLAKARADAMKTKDGEFLWNEGVMGENKDAQIKSRITVLRNNARLVDETARHQMLQRADRLQKILDGGVSTARGPVAATKAVR